MTHSTPGLEIIKLWSSVFLEKDLPDHEAATQQLIALAENRPGDGVFAIDDPGVNWLKLQVAHAVNLYLSRAGYAQVPQWSARARFSIQQFGEYRSLANQPGADLVGIYVMSWPSRHDNTGSRDDGLPGYLSFYDPRVAMNMNAIKRDPYHGYHQSLRPRPGLLLLWPAYVSYFMHPNLSREPAMCVAYQVQLQSGRVSPR
jgi:hypothetical protein